jgi:formylglycine-generating enzyme required for sulfatase activity
MYEVIPAFPAITETSFMTLIPTSSTVIVGTLTSEPLHSATKTSTPQPIEILDYHNVPMVQVPAGEFEMGGEKYDDERPVHTVLLDSYYIDKYEVTNFAYRLCVLDGACLPPKQQASATRTLYYGNSDFNEYPVVSVDWNMATNYCEWRDGRLPTEAEWEKAARGTDGRTYPWGEEIGCNVANYQNNCIGDTSAVGSYSNGVSYYGLYDMAGNVWEWVNDWYDDRYYQISPLVNPLGPNSGQYRVLRGGSWYTNSIYVRVSHRYGDIPINFSPSIGFRCAKDAP